MNTLGLNPFDRSIRPAPMTSTERSRLFRERHPGYHASYQARRRGSREATSAATLSKLRALLAADRAAAAQPIAALPAPAMMNAFNIPNACPTTTAEASAISASSASSPTAC